MCSMWLNGGADLVLVLALACSNGVDEPLPFGAAGAGENGGVRLDHRAAV